MAGLRVWCEKDVYETGDFKLDLKTNGFSLLPFGKSDVSAADVAILAPPGSRAEELTAMGRIVIEVSKESKEDCDKFNVNYKMTGHRKVSQSVINKTGMLTEALLAAVLAYHNVHTLRNTMVELYGVLQRAQVTSVNRLMAKMGVPAPSALIVNETDVDTDIMKDGAENLSPPPDAVVNKTDSKLQILYIPRDGAALFNERDVLHRSLSLPVIVAAARESPDFDVQRMQQVRAFQETFPTAMLALVMYNRNLGVPIGREQHLAILADGVLSLIHI